MRGFVVSVIVATIAVWLTVQVVPAPFLEFGGEPVQALGLGLIFGVVNGFIKPIVKALALPIRLVTLGLIGIVINIAAFIGVAWLAGQVGIDFTVGGFPPDLTSDTLVGAAIGGIVMGVISAAIGLVVHD